MNRGGGPLVMRNFCFLLTILLLQQGCVKGSGSESGAQGPDASAQQESNQDGGPQDGGPQSAADDAGSTAAAPTCTADSMPPSVQSGGIASRPEVLPSIQQAQHTAWQRVSNDPECDAVTPVAALPNSLTWQPGVAAACAAATSGGQGSITVDWTDGSTAINSFFTADGMSAAAIANGPVGSLIKEDQIWTAPGAADGFALLSQTFSPLCAFARSVSPDGVTGPAVLVDSSVAGTVKQIVRNPRGGFALVRTTFIGDQQPFTQTLDLRFVDDHFAPLGDWNTVTVYHTAGADSFPAELITWSVNIDQTGKALVRTFTYPPSFGPPPAPSDWKFSARWMDQDGPLTDEFQPVSPVFTPASPSGVPLFAGWGSVLPLIEGGFAVYHYPVDPSLGTISPVGWYGSYSPGSVAIASPPTWLQAYDGSLVKLALGNGYIGRDVDQTTCMRTVYLIGISGQKCFTLPVEDTTTCTVFPDTLWPDGTLILQDAVSSTRSCMVRWWPGLARTTQ